MVLMHSPFCDTNFKAKDFRLKATDGKEYSFLDIKGEKATLIMFICNHCPYVKTIISKLVEDVKKLQENGVGAVAIMPNDTDEYPEDNFENMKKFAKEHNFTFPYLIDETQEVAKSYDAICTPDFFGFNADDMLRYRGRLDEVTPSNIPDEDVKRELLNAMLYIADTGNMPKKQTPSMGCSIKWKNKVA